MNELPDQGADPAMEQAAPMQEPEPLIVRAADQEQEDEPVDKFIKRWTATIKAAKKYHEKAFKRMKKNRQLVRYGCDKAWHESGKYRTNITLRHVTRKAADLYARNPRAVAKRRTRLDYKIWDGNPLSLQQAQMALQEGIMDPNAMALLQEVQSVKQQQLMLTRVGETLQALFHHSLDSQQPSFKVQAKGAVRKSVIDGASFVKLDFYREFESDLTPLLQDQAPHPAQLEGTIRSAADHASEDNDEASKVDAALAQASLQAHQENIISREGMLYTFLAADELIIDPKCRNLRSFEGADWIAYEALRSPEQIREVYGVDLGNKFTSYNEEEVPGAKRFESSEEGNKNDKGAALVWEVQDKRTGNVFTLADGYDHFLEEPAAPMIILDRFFNAIPLLFNEIESPDELYPPSDVEMLEHAQYEYNRARHGLREHRQASRPRYVAPKGKFEEPEKEMIANCGAHTLIEMAGLVPGESIQNVVQAFPTLGVDPNLYETGSILDDTLRSTGSQEANFGGTSGSTATESQIAEGSRVASVNSNVDDLDDWLSELAECAGAALFQNMSMETVTKIAGPGAVWPEFMTADVSAEMFLEVKAGSAGRPNKAAELANLERAAPILLQTPGVDPVWFAREVIKRLDDGLDIDEALVSGMPSMVAQNAAVGRASTDPNSATAGGGENGQGGANNAPDPQTNEPGPQGGFPA